MKTYEADEEDAARIVLGKLKEAQPKSDKIITFSDLYQMAEVDPPCDPTTVQEMHKHGLWQVEFITILRRKAMKVMGRWLVNVRGEGYRLLAVGEVVPDAESMVDQKIGKALRDFKFRAKHVPDSSLTIEQRQEKVDASNRVGILAATFRRKSRMDTIMAMPTPASPEPVRSGVASGLEVAAIA